MYELITDKTLAEYEAFVQSHPKGNFAQSSLWAKQKPMWTWDAVAVRGEDGKIKGSLALMTRKVPGIGRTLMYGCRGPVCDLDDRETFAQLLEGAKALAKKYKSYVIKLDPDVPSSNTAFAALMQSFGFRCKEGGKNFEAIQPRYVFRLNVEGKTEEELMAAFHQKWRYNIRLAERKGVSVTDLRQGNGSGVRRSHADDRRARRLCHAQAGVFCEHARQSRRACAALHGL